MRTFGHYTWWVLATTLTVLAFARWFPDLEIALYLHAFIPLNSLLWLNFWLVRLFRSSVFNER